MHPRPATPLSPVFAFISAAASFALCTEGSAATLHVPAEYPTIASALAIAASGDSVVIGCGTYFESYLQLPSGVTIRSESDDPNCVTIDAQSQGGFVGHALLDLTTLQGITIRNAEEGGGAALRCISDCVVQVSNCVFRENKATDGAAVGMSFNCDVRFSDCVFESNQATLAENQRGGAIIVNSSKAQFEKCAFQQNSAQRGGAVFCFNAAELEFADCQFVGNTAITGGALRSEGDDCTVEIVDCQFLGNTANGGGALSIEGSSRLEIGGTWFESNEAMNSDATAGIGGAVVVRVGASSRISTSTFKMNSAGLGGAIAALGGSGLELVACEFFHNEAESGGAPDICWNAVLPSACPPLGQRGESRQRRWRSSCRGSRND